MDYNFDKDFKAIRDVLDISQKEFAKVLDTEQKTISNIESKDSYPSKTIVESAFTYAFKKDVKINKLKELLCRDNLSHNERHKQLQNGLKAFKCRREDAFEVMSSEISPELEHVSPYYRAT